MKIVLYSTGCPRCQVLEKKLEQKNIAFEKVTDTELMQKMGMVAVPMLEVDGAPIMDYMQAINWLKEVEYGNN